MTKALYRESSTMRTWMPGSPLFLPGGGRCNVPGCRSGVRQEVGGEMEGAPPARRALGPDSAVHQEHQLFADGQAQAGAAELPGGGAVRLGEGVEDGPELARRDARAGIGDRELQAGQALLLAGWLHGQPHAPFPG